MSNAIKRLSMRDLEENRESFLSELLTGLQECGFVILRDHAIDCPRREHAYHLLERLFALPVETKLKYDSKDGGRRGYTAFGRENAKGNPHTDLKEFWHVGQELHRNSAYVKDYPENVWPAEIPEFEAFFKSFYRDLESLGKTILEALGEAMNLKPNFFRKMVTDGNSICRLLHYPATKHLDTQHSVRAASHADINLLTLLVGATDSGLELLDQNGKWKPVVSSEDEIVLDTGDMMARLTNDVLPATVHRVVNPINQERSRYSIPFFLHPHSKASLECLPQCVGPHGSKYPPITAGEFLERRLVEIGLTKY
jgi:isopenicillin N synthase-like dioxygenase